MTTISDEYMRTMIAAMKTYCIVILKAGPNREMPGVEKSIWEQARRNLALRAEGKLSIVCPINDGSDVCGIGIFNTTLAEARSIMEKDPAVLQKVFICEFHVCRSFPGDCLPG